MKDAFLRTHRELIDFLASCWATFPRNKKFENDSRPHFRKSDASSSSYQSLEQAFQDFQWEKKMLRSKHYFTFEVAKSYSRKHKNWFARRTLCRFVRCSEMGRCFDNSYSGTSFR